MIARLHDFAPTEPRLVVGAAPTSLEDVQRLAAHGVTGVLSLQSDDDLAAQGLRWSVLWQLHVARGIEPVRVPIRDFDRKDLLRHIDAALAALDAHFAEDRRVYLHCTAGLNRSPTLALAHLTRSLGLEAATTALFSCHPEALPDLEVVGRWWKRRAP